jgi:cell shape-determining protein MreD
MTTITTTHYRRWVSIIAAFVSGMLTCDLYHKGISPRDFVPLLVIAVVALGVLYACRWFVSHKEA